MDTSGLGTLRHTNYHMSRQVSYSLAVGGNNIAKGSVMLILKIRRANFQTTYILINYSYQFNMYVCVFVYV